MRNQPSNTLPCSKVSADEFIGGQAVTFLAMDETTAVVQFVCNEQSATGVGTLLVWGSKVAERPCAEDIARAYFGNLQIVFSPMEMQSFVLKDPRAMTKEEFLELQEDCEGLDMAHAMGRDLAGHYVRVKAIDEAMNASPWTLHPDHGCVRKADVNRLDRESA